MSLGQYGFSKFESLKLLMDCIVEQTECEGRLHSNLFITKPLDIKSQESSMICFNVFNLNLYRLTHFNFSFLPSHSKPTISITYEARMDGADCRLFTAYGVTGRRPKTSSS